MLKQDTDDNEEQRVLAIVVDLRTGLEQCLGKAGMVADLEYGLEDIDVAAVVVAAVVVDSVEKVDTAACTVVVLETAKHVVKLADIADTVGMAAEDAAA